MDGLSLFGPEGIPLSQGAPAELLGEVVHRGGLLESIQELEAGREKKRVMWQEGEAASGPECDPWDKCALCGTGHISPIGLMDPIRSRAACRVISRTPYRSLDFSPLRPLALTEKRGLGLGDDALMGQEIIRDNVVHLFDFIEQAVGQGDQLVGL